MIRLAHDADSANLPVWVAQEEGFFKEHGLDIKFTEVQNIGPLPTALGESFDIVETPITALISAAAEGIGIQGIAANGGVETPESPTASLLVLKSSGITSVDQLEGKVLGAITISGTIHLATAYWLDNEGVDLDEIDVREVDLPTQFDQLKAGRIDAVETVTSFRAGMLASGLVHDLGNPKLKLGDDVKSLVWAASPEWVSDNKSKLEEFRAAVDEGIEFINNNEGKAREILEKYSGLPREVAQETIFPAFASEVSVSDIQMWLEAMNKVGDFKGTVDPDQLVAG